MAGRSVVLLGLCFLTMMQDVKCLDKYEDGKFYRTDSSLTEVPTDIPRYATEIYLNNNAITKIKADDFRNATHCKSVNLENNLISEIEIGSFKSLSIIRYLTLKNNRLDEPKPNIFKELLVLESLDVGGNAMRFIPNGLFTGLTNLNTLIMIGNIFSELKSNSFQGLDSLKRLVLHGCNIRTIQPNAFYGLTHLTTLELHDNTLTELIPDVFNGLNELRNVLLHDNKLSLLDVEVFRELPRPFQISITWGTTDNNLECDDNLCWLKKEEEAGTATWYANKHPKCRNDVDWNNWNCTEQVSAPLEPVTRSSQASEEQSTKSSIHDNESEGDENVPLATSLGVVGGIDVAVIATIIIVALCLKRRGINICQRSGRSLDDGYVNPVKPSVQLQPAAGGGNKNQDESAASIPREPLPPRPASNDSYAHVSNDSYAHVYDHLNHNDSYVDVE